MENLSYSLPNKTFPGKTVYDDVFGGPPKFGVPTLSPRVEDYAEIFQGFRLSRGSSIPILDIPAVQNDVTDLFVDVRSSKFDYFEVFGGINGLDFAVSYEELFKKSDGGDDSSFEAWTPAQSESLSDESNPSACSEKNQSLSSGDLHHTYDDTKQLNISYNKANPKGKEDVLKGMTTVTQLDTIPGYSFKVGETHFAQKLEDENLHLHLNLNTDFGGEVTERKHLRKTMSQPPHSNFDVQVCESLLSPWVGHDKASSPQKAFISVSDISLRTQPAHEPPPSRPPPDFSNQKGNSNRLNSKFKASNSYAFESFEADSPPYFNAEIDASSSAAAASMKDAVQKAQAQLESAKELMERKKDVLQTRTKLHLENDRELKAEKIGEFDEFNCFKNEKVQKTCERECNLKKTCDAEQRKKGRDSTQVVSCAIDGEDHITVAGKSALNALRKEHTSSRGSQKTGGTVAWSEETQFFEVVETKEVKDERTPQHSSDFVHKEKDSGGSFERKEYNRRVEEDRVNQEQEGVGEKFEVLKGANGKVDNKGRRIATKELNIQEEPQDKANVGQKVREWQENENKTEMISQLAETKKILYALDKCENTGIVTEYQQKDNEEVSKQILNGVNERVEFRKRIKKSRERKVRGREMEENFDSKKYEREFKEDVQPVGNGRKLKKKVDLGTKEKWKKEFCEREEIEKKKERAREIGENKKYLKEALESEGIVKRSEEVIEQQDSANKFKPELKQKENKKEQTQSCETEQNETNADKAFEQEENAKKQEKAYEGEESKKILNDDCKSEKNEKRLKEAWQKEEFKKRLPEADKSEEGSELQFKEEDTEDRSKETSERVDGEKTIEDDSNSEGLRRQNSVQEQIEREENDNKLNLNQGIYVRMEEQKETDEACNLGETETPQATRVAGPDKFLGNLESKKAPLQGQNERSRTELKKCESVIEENEGKRGLIEGRFNSSGMDQNDLHHENTINRRKDAKVSLFLYDSVPNSKEDGISIGRIHIEKNNGVSEIVSNTENAEILAHKQSKEKKSIKGVQYAFDQEEKKDKFMSSQVVIERAEYGRKTGDVLPAKKFASQIPERIEKSFNEMRTLEEREKEERLKRERDLENDCLRKIEEEREREREREREKDRMAVDTATREALERAERAAVERATAEVRHRALAEARERLEKASAEARERLTADKALTEARLKAERAAVERATAEARERAFEKAMAEKASFEARERVERSMADKFSANSRNSGLRQNSSSSDMLDLQYQRVGSSCDLKYSHSSIHDGHEGESTQRCKARLERHQRTAERAAKALAEKNMRDFLAHKEQEERNRLAEALDADVKRWSTGKEGNLRALLSTLQYVLGPDSGWQPIPLTEVITSVAVKKAYRKATLCVHPDKLQQRAASIQQKYICEKVFDLLKEAWNKFNSEEP